MAVALLTGGLSSLHGREGGTVYFRDPRGPEYVRTRAYNPRPGRALTAAQQHTCVGMQIAMMAYHLMTGSPFSDDWAARAILEAPFITTKNYFIKQQLLKWKLNIGPSIDPLFPGLTLLEAPSSATAYVPEGSKGVIDINVQYTSPPGFPYVIVFLAGSGSLDWNTALAVQAIFIPVGDLSLKASGIRLLPGFYATSACTIAFDGTVLPLQSSSGDVLVL